MELKCFCHFFSFLRFDQTKNVFRIIAVELVTVNTHVKTVMNRYFPALQTIILWISLLCIISSSVESASFRASANKVSNTLIRYASSSYDLWHLVARHCTLYCHFVDTRVYSDTNNLKNSFFSHNNWRFYISKLSLSKGNKGMKLV